MRAEPLMELQSALEGMEAALAEILGLTGTSELRAASDEQRINHSQTAAARSGGPQAKEAVWGER